MHTTFETTVEFDLTEPEAVTEHDATGETYTEKTLEELRMLDQLGLPPGRHMMATKDTGDTQHEIRRVRVTLLMNDDSSMRRLRMKPTDTVVSYYKSRVLRNGRRCRPQWGHVIGSEYDDRWIALAIRKLRSLVQDD